MSVSRQMVSFAFGWFRLADTVNLFPIKLDSKSWKFSHSESAAKRNLHSIFFMLSCIKSLHLVYAVVSRLLDGSVTAVTIMTALWGGLTLLSTYWSYEIFHRRVSELTLLFNCLDFAHQRHRDLLNYGTEDESSEASVAVNASKISKLRKLVFDFKSFLIKLQRMNLQEQFLVVFPLSATPALPVYLALIILLPHWSIFSTSLLPPGSGAFIFWMFVGLEFIVAFTTVTNLVFLFFLELALQVNLFGGVDAVLQGMSRTKAKRQRGCGGEWYLTSGIGFLQEFYLIVTLCNILFKRILFTGKLRALNCCIFGTYYVLSHYKSGSPIVLLFLAFISIQSMAIYLISCRKLFEVPTFMGNLKGGCLSVLFDGRDGMTPSEVKIFKYQIKAVPAIGISEGGFRYMDSTSTLVFMDFVASQIISLMLI